MTVRDNMGIRDASRPLGERVRSDGFASIPNVVTGREIADVLAMIERSELPRSRAGMRHAMRNRAVAAIARDTRLLALAQEVLGTAALPFRATLFDKSRASNWLVVWHQDTALPFGERREVTRIGVLSDETLDELSTQIVAVDCLVPRGGILAMRPLLVHRSSKSQSNAPRRILHIEYATSAAIAKGLDPSHGVMGRPQALDQRAFGLAIWRFI